MGKRALNSQTGELEMQESRLPPEARWEQAVSGEFFWDYDIEVFLEPIQGGPQ